MITAIIYPTSDYHKWFFPNGEASVGDISATNAKSLENLAGRLGG